MRDARPARLRHAPVPMRLMHSMPRLRLATGFIPISMRLLGSHEGSVHAAALQAMAKLSPKTALAGGMFRTGCVPLLCQVASKLRVWPLTS